MIYTYLFVWLFFLVSLINELIVIILLIRLVESYIYKLKRVLWLTIVPSQWVTWFPNPNSIFTNSFFLLGVAFKIFLFYLVFLLKNKTNISGNSKLYIYQIFTNKKQIVPTSGNALKNKGSQYVNLIIYNKI